MHNGENMENASKIKVFKKSNISAMKDCIFMKFYTVINYYLVNCCNNDLEGTNLKTNSMSANLFLLDNPDLSSKKID